MSNRFYTGSESGCGSAATILGIVFLFVLIGLAVMAVTG